MTREEAIQRFQRMKKILSIPNSDAERTKEAIDMAIEALSAQGVWIEEYNGNGWNDFWDYTCSNCGKKYERANAVLYHANYCPNCGAVMSVPIQPVELKKGFTIDDNPQDYEPRILGNGDMHTYMKIFRCANVKRCNTIKKILLGFAPERKNNGNG